MVLAVVNQLIREEWSAHARQDIRQVVRIAREEGVDRRKFGEYLHRCKQAGDYGSGPNGDFTEDELRQKSRELRDQQRK